MIYILRNPESPLVLIGTADWIAEKRRQILDIGLMRPGDEGVQTGSRLRYWTGLPPWMRNLRCIGMLEGDQDEIHREFSEEKKATDGAADVSGSALIAIPDGTPTDEFPWDSAFHGIWWFAASPRLLAWIEANASPWDGSESENLGVKGLGRKARAAAPPVPMTSGLGGRLRRMRAGETTVR